MVIFQFFRFLKQSKWLKWTNYLFHFESFYMKLDLIQDYSSLRDIHRQYKQDLVIYQKSCESLKYRILLNIYYLFPLLSMWGAMFDSGWILYKAKFHYTAEGLPDMISHKFFPVQLRHQGDFCIHMGNVLVILILSILIFKPFLHPKCRIYACFNDFQPILFCDGKIWSLEYAAKICNYRRKARKFFTFAMICAYIQTWAYFTGNSIMNWSHTWRDVCLILMQPFFDYYSLFCIVYSSFFITLTVHYTHIRQRILVGKLRTLTRRLNFYEEEKEKRLNKYWSEFIQINNEIMKLQEEMRLYNKFWSPILSSYFAAHISIVVFLMHGFIFENEETAKLSLGERSFFVFFSLACAQLLIMITAECSAIVFNSQEIFRLTRIFCTSYSQHLLKSTGNTSGNHFNKLLFIFYLLKIDRILSNEKANRYGFCLINSAIIDSKMFELLLLYMSDIFFKLFRN